MSEQELRYSISPIVLIALILAVTAEYCKPPIISSWSPVIKSPSPFNPICYVSRFDPEATELQRNNLTPISNSAFYVDASGTANSTASPSPSAEIPEDY